jgi:hypothetical protein
MHKAADYEPDDAAVSNVIKNGVPDKYRDVDLEGGTRCQAKAEEE